jgi:hypothetical protein
VEAVGGISAVTTPNQEMRIVNEDCGLRVCMLVDYGHSLEEWHVQLDL